MGADGHVKIWKLADVEAHPRGKEIIESCPNGYIDELFGERYFHAYWGDNLFMGWGEPSDWYGGSSKAEVQEWIQFLNSLPHAQWELWT